MISGETLKNAIVLLLNDIDGDADVYKEAVSAPEYPHYYVHQITVSDEKDRCGRHFLDYSFDIRYRVASDPSTDMRLQRDLDAKGLALMAAFDMLDTSEGGVWCTQKDFEKEEGVLHFFFHMVIPAILTDGAQDALQEELGVKMEARGGSFAAKK